MAGGLQTLAVEFSVVTVRMPVKCHEERVSSNLVEWLTSKQVSAVNTVEMLERRSIIHVFCPGMFERRVLTWGKRRVCTPSSLLQQI